MGEIANIYFIVAIVTYFMFFCDYYEDNIKNISLAIMWPIVCGVIAAKALRDFWKQES